MSHVVCTNFVDLQELLVDGFVVVYIFGVDAILPDILDSLDVVSQLVLQLDKRRFLFLQLFLLFLGGLARCLYFFRLFFAILILFGLLLLVGKDRGSHFLFWCRLFCLFLLVLLRY